MDNEIFELEKAISDRQRKLMDDIGLVSTEELLDNGLLFDAMALNRLMARLIRTLKK